MKRRVSILALVLAVALVAAVVGRRLLVPAATIHAATNTVAPAQSYLVILGVGDTSGTNWDGSITVTGATIEILRGWRFTATDSITGTPAGR